MELRLLVLVATSLHLALGNECPSHVVHDYPLANLEGWTRYIAHLRGSHRISICSVLDDRCYLQPYSDTTRMSTLRSLCPTSSIDIELSGPHVLAPA